MCETSSNFALFLPPTYINSKSCSHNCPDIAVKNSTEPCRHEDGVEILDVKCCEDGSGKMHPLKVDRPNRSTTTGCLVTNKVIKATHNDTHARLELEILRRLGNHPNIVKLVDYQHCKHRVVLYQEYIGGGNLVEYVNLHYRDNRIPEPVIWSWLRDITAGLIIIHRDGWVHRDIKPSNLLVTRDGRVKIGDFGVSGPVGHQGCYAGTLGYTSPEMHTRRYSLHPSADMWMLGCTLYWLMTGTHLFGTDNYSYYLVELTNFCPDGLVFLQSVAFAYSDNLLELLRALLSLDPKDRPESQLLYDYIVESNQA